MVTSDLSLSKDVTCSLECKMRGQKSGFGVDFNSSQHQMCISIVFFICVVHQTIQFFQVNSRKVLTFSSLFCSFT